MWTQHPFIHYDTDSSYVCMFMSNSSLDESVVFKDLFDSGRAEFKPLRGMQYENTTHLGELSWQEGYMKRCKGKDFSLDFVFGEILPPVATGFVYVCYQHNSMS